MGASLGNLGEGSYAGHLRVEGGSGTGVFPYRGLVGEPVEGESIYWELWELAEGGLWLWSISLHGSSVKETWREGSLAGDPGG